MPLPRVAPAAGCAALLLALTVTGTTVPAPAAAAAPTAGLADVAAAPSAGSADPAVVGGPALATPGVAVDPAAPPLPAVSASGFLVADLDTGRVLAARDPHGAYAPASTLKALTAVTLLPRLPPALLVTPSRDDVDVDGTKVGLVTSLQYPVSELFTALLVVSANDAAGALAEAAGGMPATTALMNAEAAHLQAHDTHAVNASGLDAPGQVSSPYDLALIARAGFLRTDFRGYVGTRRSSVDAPGGQHIEIDTHNRLLAGYPGDIGGKNGFTELARASYLGAATRDGHTIAVTLMHSEPGPVWPDAAALLDWGFAARAAGVAPVGMLVPPLPAAGAVPAAATASAATDRPAPGVPRAGDARRRSGGVSRTALGWVAVPAALLAVAVLLLRRRSASRRLRA